MLLDGFLDNLDLMLPILEEQGFIGWLFISPLFFSTFPRPINAPMRRRISCTRQSATDTGKRIALDWDEARAISARGHVFACHSRTHFESKPETPLDVLEDEIVSAKAEMEREFGVEVDCFCWLRGAPLGVNLNASTLLRVAGFRGLFSKFRF